MKNHSNPSEENTKYAEHEEADRSWKEAARLLTLMRLCFVELLQCFVS